MNKNNILYEKQTLEHLNYISPLFRKQAISKLGEAATEKQISAFAKTLLSAYLESDTLISKELVERECGIKQNKKGI